VGGSADGGGRRRQADRVDEATDTPIACGVGTAAVVCDNSPSLASRRTNPASGRDHGEERRHAHARQGRGPEQQTASSEAPWPACRQSALPYPW